MKCCIVYMCVCVCVRLSVCLFVGVRLCVCAWTRACLFVYACVCVCVCVWKVCLNITNINDFWTTAPDFCHYFFPPNSYYRISNTRHQFSPLECKNRSGKTAEFICTNLQRKQPHYRIIIDNNHTRTSSSLRLPSLWPVSATLPLKTNKQKQWVFLAPDWRHVC